MNYLPTDRTILQRGPWADSVFWFVYTLSTQIAFAPDPFHPVNLLIMLAFLAGEVVAVYGHLHFGLFPLLRKARGLPGYGLVLIGAVVAGILVCWLGLALIGLGVVELRTSLDPVVFVSYWANRIGWSIGTLLALSSGLLLFIYRSRQSLREQQLETARTQAELAFLRGQLNPHFLFNALNSIYLLIDREPETAKDSLLGFSDLLRYQLYASEAATVPLSDEVAQLEKFATLSALRMEEDFTYRFDQDPDDGRRVPPMLLLPIMENAFKYSSGEGGYIQARIRLTEQATHFHLINRIGQYTAGAPGEGAGGIGLSNLRRRLDLLYPEGAKLTISREVGRFSVHLLLPTT